MKQILTFWNEAQTYSYSDTITNYLPVLPVVYPLTIDTLSFIEDSITEVGGLEHGIYFITK